MMVEQMDVWKETTYTYETTILMVNVLVLILLVIANWQEQDFMYIDTGANVKNKTDSINIRYTYYTIKSSRMIVGGLQPHSSHY